MLKQESDKGLTGWVAELNDGTVVRESDGSRWGDVRDRVLSLSLVFRGTAIKLPRGMARYFQRHSGSCELDGTRLKIISRTIGFELPSGAVMSVTANEDSSEISLETK